MLYIYLSLSPLSLSLSLSEIIHIKILYCTYRIFKVNSHYDLLYFSVADRCRLPSNTADDAQDRMARFPGEKRTDHAICLQNFTNACNCCSQWPAMLAAYVEIASAELPRGHDLRLICLWRRAVPTSPRVLCHVNSQTLELAIWHCFVQKVTPKCSSALV